MQTQRNIKKRSGIVKGTSVIFVIVSLAIFSQTSNAIEWEWVAGNNGPGVKILDELPVCWFSTGDESPQYHVRYQSSGNVMVFVNNKEFNYMGLPTVYSETITGSGIKTPFTVSFSDVRYNGLRQVLGYYANITSNEYSMETFIKDGTYNSHGQATGFKELRHYQTSGNTYYIEISDVSYNGFGQVMTGFPIKITKNSDIEIPPPASGGNPSGSWIGSMGIEGTVSKCINNPDGSSEICWSIPYQYYDIVVIISSCAQGTYTYTPPNNFQATYSGTAFEETYGISNNYTLTINGWFDSSDDISGSYIINFEPAVGWPSSNTGLGFLHRFETKTIYVDADAAGANDGSSWADAYNYLQDALMIASAGDEIRVAQGVYRPDQGGGYTQSDREATFYLIDGVTLKGSYAGFGALKPNTRDRVVYKTILSGDLSGNDDPNFTNNSENSYHVVTSSYTGEATVLDGFTITGGNALNDSSLIEQGGGMYNDISSKTTVIDCTFTANQAVDGAGMYNGFNCSPTLINCCFIGNSALEEGGGIYNDFHSQSTFTNCIFAGNSAGYHGGGIYNHQIDSLILTNCTFAYNSAENGGDAFANDYSFFEPYSHINLCNCIIWGGQNEIIFDAANNSGSNINITYSNIQGGWPGEGNIDADPLFADPNGFDNIIGTVDDELRLLEDSPCIDAGNNSVVLPSLATDIEGNPRIFDSIVDMGAYEYCDFLVAHWSMDDNAGNTMVVDSSGNGNNGTSQQNTSVLHTFGPIDAALSFNGISDFVNLGSPALLNDLPYGDFSVSAWINDQSSAGKRMIMGVYPGDSTGWVLRKQSVDSGRYIDFWIGHSDTNAYFITPGGSIVSDSWHHIIAVWYAGTKTCKIYIDGVESIYTKTEAGQGSYNSDASYDKEIGRMAYNGGIQHFEGAMDQIKIFNKTLSQEEIDELFSEG
ncbi:MAG: LamG domain-containing protein [Sedimentisphaerales bacterium]|nr:LamG domain-containing protein [Sedimentisphaerales bacterium]